MIICYGQEIVSKILLNLHIWKCTGDYDSAKSFYDKYSVVNEYFVKLIKIIKINRYSKNLELYNNLEIDLDKNIQIIDYPVTMEGIINSYVDRYILIYKDTEHFITKIFIINGQNMTPISLNKLIVNLIFDI